MRVTVAAATERTFALGDFVTEGGTLLPGAELRFRVLGDVEAAKAHGWIVIFHALTGSSDVEAWWDPLIGPGRPLDTSRHAIVAANLLGSCYGSTGPRDWAARGNGPFPLLAPADSRGPTSRCSLRSASSAWPSRPAARSAGWWRSSGDAALVPSTGS